MIPEITDVLQVGFITPTRNSGYIDYELGTSAIATPSSNGFTELWSCYYDKVTGAIQLFKVSDPEAKSTVTSVMNARYIGFAFDQNMRPSVCYSLGDDAYLYWFDSMLGTFTITHIPNAVTPCVNLDDPRAISSAVNDIVLAYISNDQLCVRYQRERFLIEHILDTLPPNRRLRQIGMNLQYRYQFLVM